MSTRAEALRDMAVIFAKYLADHDVPCPTNQPWVEHLQLLSIKKLDSTLVEMPIPANGSYKSGPPRIGG